MTENKAFTSTFLPTVAETDVAGVDNVGAGGRGKLAAVAAAVDTGTEPAGGTGGVTNVGGGVAVTTGSTGADNVGATGNDANNCDTFTFFAVAGTLLDAASVEGAAVAAAAAAGAVSVFLLMAAFALRSSEVKFLLPPDGAGAAAATIVDSTGAGATGVSGAGAGAGAGAAAAVGAFNMAVNMLAAACRSGAGVSSAFATADSSATGTAEAAFAAPTGFAASANVRRGKMVTLPGSVAEGDEGAFFTVRPNFCFNVSDAAAVVFVVVTGTAEGDGVDPTSEDALGGAVSRFFSAVAFDALAVLSFFWSTAGAVTAGAVVAVGALFAGPPMPKPAFSSCNEATAEVFGGAAVDAAAAAAGAGADTALAVADGATVAAVFTKAAFKAAALSCLLPPLAFFDATCGWWCDDA